MQGARSSLQIFRLPPQQCSRFCCKMKRTAAGNRIAFYPVPRCRRHNGTAKIQSVKGAERKIVLRSLQKYFSRPLTDWIGGTDDRGRGFRIAVFCFFCWYGASRRLALIDYLSTPCARIGSVLCGSFCIICSMLRRMVSALLISSLSV